MSCLETSKRERFVIIIAFSEDFQLNPKRRISASEAMMHSYFTDLPPRVHILPNSQFLLCFSFFKKSFSSFLTLKWIPWVENSQKDGGGVDPVWVVPGEQVWRDSGFYTMYSQLLLYRTGVGTKI